MQICAVFYVLCMSRCIFNALVASLAVNQVLSYIPYVADFTKSTTFLSDQCRLQNAARESFIPSVAIYCMQMDDPYSYTVALKLLSTAQLDLLVIMATSCFSCLHLSPTIV